jgi:hypothetical protein
MIKQIITEEDYRLVHDLTTEHNRIASRIVEHKSFDEFMNRVKAKNPVTIGYFDNNGNLMSMLMSAPLSAIPSWFFVLVTTRKTSRFNMSTSGIPELIEATVSYWEDKGINSFLYIQSTTHRSYINGEEMKKHLPSNAKFHDYMAPGVTLELLKANTRSKYSLIDSLCQESLFPKDVIIKWTFKKSLMQDYS